MLHLACQRLATIEDLKRFCNCDVLDLDDDDLNDVLDQASDALVRLSGLRLGRCETKIRPCRDSCQFTACGCCELRGIKLDGVDPVVTSVLIDGEAVDSNTYAVISRPNGDRYLERFRIDGRPDRWPGCQPLGLASTEAGTFEVTYEVGQHPDAFMRNAVAEIACDVLEPYVNGTDGELPDGVESVDGYGIRMGFRRGAEMADADVESVRGLNWVQRFLGIYARPKGSAAWSPEISDGYTIFSR